jgi:hypothetical protein
VLLTQLQLVLVVQVNHQAIQLREQVALLLDLELFLLVVAVVAVLLQCWELRERLEAVVLAHLAVQVVLVFLVKVLQVVQEIQMVFHTDQAVEVAVQVP